MRILLVNPPMMYVESVERVWTSTHLHLMYSYLLSQGHEIEVYDALEKLGLPCACGETDEYIERLTNDLISLEFDIAGISCWTSFQYLGSMEVGKIIRKHFPEKILLVGGWHPTSLPEDFLGGSSPFDYVVQGPGEAVWKKLITKEKKRPSQAVVLQGEPIPFDCISIDWSYPCAKQGIFLSRGCPHRCLYCHEGKMPRNCYGLERAVEEYLQATKHVPAGDFVHVQDACFGVDKQWRRAFLSKIANLVSNNVRLDVEMRIDQMEPEDSELLGACRATVYFGLESGSTHTLGIMRKAPNPAKYLSRCLQVLKECDRNGVEYYVGFLYNHPGETRKALAESIEFYWKLLWDGPSDNLLGFVSHRFAYFPGSPFDALQRDFEKRWGTVIRHPTWWRTPMADHRQRAEDNVASHDLPCELATEMAQRIVLANWLNASRRVAVKQRSFSQSGAVAPG